MDNSMPNYIMLYGEQVSKALREKYPAINPNAVISSSEITLVMRESEPSLCILRNTTGPGTLMLIERPDGADFDVTNIGWNMTELTGL